MNISDAWLVQSEHEANILRCVEGRHFRTALDIGAHCGLWTLELAFLSDEVFAYEPHPEAFRILQHRMKMDPACGNVVCRNAAMWWRTGRIALNLYGDIASHSTCLFSNPVNNNPTTGSIVVDSSTLDESFPCLDKHDFVKIDTEGAECEIVRAGLKAMQYPSFVVECHTDSAIQTLSRVLSGAKVLEYSTSKYLVRINEDSVA